MKKQAELYRGKAKTVYSTDNPDLLVLEFRNDTSAGDVYKRQIQLLFLTHELAGTLHTQQLQQLAQRPGIRWRLKICLLYTSRCV